MTVVFDIDEKHPNQKNAAAHCKLHNTTGKMKCADIDKVLHNAIPPENGQKKTTVRVDGG